MIPPRLVEALRNMCWCGRDSCDACLLAMVDWLDFVRYKPSAFDKLLAPPDKYFTTIANGRTGWKLYKAVVPMGFLPSEAPTAEITDHKWVIIKASRNYLGGPSYDGPTRRRAGSPQVVFYVHKANADFDAELMSKHNPVGFRVVPYRPIE